MSTITPQILKKARSHPSQRELALQDYIDGHISADDYIYFMQQQNDQMDKYRDAMEGRSTAFGRLAHVPRSFGASLRHLLSR